MGGTPVFLGWSAPNPHIPKERVVGSAETLQRLGADVTVRLCPNLVHAVSQDELVVVGTIMNKLVAR